MSTLTHAAQALTGIPHLAAGLGAQAPFADNPSADFSDTPWWLYLVKALLVFVFLLVNTLLVIWFERRVIGRMQQRPGPNRTGPFGLLQTLADGMKLALKEDITPEERRQARLHRWPRPSPAPWRSCRSRSSRSGPTVSMFGHRTPLQLTDFPVAVLLVLAVAGVGVYGIVLAGWSSGSTYPLLGGAALDRPGDLLRDRDGPVAGRRLPLRRVDVDLADRRRAEATSGTSCRSFPLRRLRRHDGRRDQPPAVRPAPRARAS